jgi:hypothetical protein
MLMRKIAAILTFISILPALSLSAFTKSDFDRMVDFNLTLKELSLAIAANKTAGINLDKIYIINGTVALVSPEKFNSFDLAQEDLVNPIGFVSALRGGTDPIGSSIFRSLPPRLQKELNVYSGTQEEALTGLLKELKKIIRAKSLLSSGMRPALPISAGVLALANNPAGKESSEEETGFVNRLVLEEAYPSFIRKYSCTIDIAESEWIGYESITTYRSLIRLQGADCFRFFVRQDKENASPEYIPAFSTIVTVVKLDKIISLPDGTKAWLLEGLYIRQVK